MQFVGITFFVLGYGAVYTGVQMLRRPAGGSSGSYLYWVTGIDSLGAPSGGSAGQSSGGSAKHGSGSNKPKGVKGVRLIK
jgi:hypothetical protein